MNETIPTIQPPPEPRKRPAWIFELLLVLILLLGGALRLRGIYWGEFTYMHPDERFLVWVGTDIQPIGSETLGIPPSASQPGMQWRSQFPEEYPDCEAWGGYFDASCSSLNPNNRGHAFYVYGTLPMFLARYVTEWVFGHSGFSEMTQVGRPLSAMADLLMVFLVYLLGSRLYNKRVGLLAAAFSAFAVLQIQQSHFFTMDTFITLFTLLAFYFAARIALLKDESHAAEEASPESGTTWQRNLKIFTTQPEFWLSVCFGIALGMAVASKLNAVLVAWTLPAAMLVRLAGIPAEKRGRWLAQAAVHLGLAAFMSLLVFRIFQPYAFTGPGFFGLKPNPMWVSNIKELMAQGSGDVDFPPSLQWARRTILYSGQNLVQYGLGIALGIAAWAGFLWVGWRILRGEWQRHVLIWSWTAFYFGWQSLAFNPTMRYQLPVYPTLAIFAAWGIITLYDLPGKARQWRRPLAVGIGSLILVLTLGWAIAFSGIYVRPFTRAEASRWIYNNIPGPFNLKIETEDGAQNQIIPFSYNGNIRPTSPFTSGFTAQYSGWVREVYLPHVSDRAVSGQPILLNLTLSLLPAGESPIGNARVIITPIPGARDYVLSLDAPMLVFKDQPVYLNISQDLGYQQLTICGEVTLGIEGLTDIFNEVMAIPDQCALLSETPVSIPFTSPDEGRLMDITLSQVIESVEAEKTATTLTIRLASLNQPDQVASASLTHTFEPDSEGRGQGYTLTFEAPIMLKAGQAYQFDASVNEDGGNLLIEGSAVANEGDWDDGLPLRMSGYDGFGGIYTPGLNFNMYTEENQDKLERFYSILDQAEYIFISSNRQWGSLPRLPERFPLSTVYYRSLLGCPDDKTVFWCYAEAEPGMFEGSLGFELVYIEQSNPSIGPLRSMTSMPRKHSMYMSIRKCSSSVKHQTTTPKPYEIS
jgi:hypothetical protein